MSQYQREQSYAQGIMVTRRQYKKGRRDQMNLAWKESLRERLAERNMSQADLEHAIGAAKGAVARILSEEQTSSVWVHAICIEMDIPPPGPRSDEEEALLSMYRLTTPDNKKALMQLASALSAVRPKRSS